MQKISKFIIYFTAFVGFNASYATNDGACNIRLEGEIVSSMIDDINKLDNCQKISVSISSGGGDGKVALDLSDVLIAKKASIFVDRICLSACADILLPSATSITAVDGAVIGFHGNPLMKMALAMRYKPPGWERCSLKPVERMAKLYQRKNLNLSFWKDQIQRLQLENFFINPDATEGRCPTMTMQFKNRMWMPSAQQIKNKLGLSIQGKLCSDLTDCPEAWFKSYFRSGTVIVVDEELSFRPESALSH